VRALCLKTSYIGVEAQSVNAESSLPTKRQAARAANVLLKVVLKVVSLCIGQSHPVRYQRLIGNFPKKGNSV